MHVHEIYQFSWFTVVYIIFQGFSTPNGGMIKDNTRWCFLFLFCF